MGCYLFLFWVARAVSAKLHGKAKAESEASRQKSQLTLDARAVLEKALHGKSKVESEALRQKFQLTLDARAVLEKPHGGAQAGFHFMTQPILKQRPEGKKPRGLWMAFVP